MTVFLIIFMIVSALAGIGSITYVTVDVIVEAVKNGKAKKEAEPVNEEPQKEEPAPASVIVPVAEEEKMPEMLESISAEDADKMISDDLAMSGVVYEEAKREKGAKNFVNIGVINEAFSDGDTVDIEALRQKRLVPKNTTRVKILADGVLSKPLTVKADSYSVQAIKMIELTGGTVVQIKTVK